MTPAQAVVVVPAALVQVTLTSFPSSPYGNWVQSGETLQVAPGSSTEKISLFEGQAVQVIGSACIVGWRHVIVGGATGVERLSGGERGAEHRREHPCSNRAREGKAFENVHVVIAGKDSMIAANGTAKRLNHFSLDERPSRREVARRKTAAHMMPMTH